MLNKSKYLVFSVIYICLFVIISQGVFAQIDFKKIPKNNQVFQRNDQDEATITVNGNVSENGHQSISLSVFQDEQNVFQEKIALNSSKDFNFYPKLKAGNFNYKFVIKLDETNEVRNITRVAIGDIYLVYGQSNALGNAGDNVYQPTRNEFCRYYYSNYFNVNDFSWVLPFETFLRPGTGTMELQKQIADKYKFPVAMIIASAGGSNLKNLVNRNSQNPTDKDTYYGNMLAQTINSDVKENLKYIIFRQGESDGSNNDILGEYVADFDKFYQNLNNDFPNLKKIFNFQTDILTEGQYGGVLREFQRKTDKLYPKITTISSVGTTGFDGLHYNLDGYKQTAFELARIIGREVYNDNQSAQIYAPNIKKISKSNNQLILEFTDNMEMVYPDDKTVNGFSYSMKDFFYINGESNKVNSGFATGNKVIIDVQNIDNAKTVSYLPSIFGVWGQSRYEGVYLKNALGMRAFSFDKVEIGGVIIETVPTKLTLNVEVNADVLVKLSWNAENGKTYHIERSDDNTNFSEIGKLNSDVYYDTQASLGKTYYYRIYEETSPNSKSNTKDITLKCLQDINLSVLPPLNYIGAINSISAIITINKTKALTLEANKSIDLNHGFDAELGSDFTAEIGGCKNN